LRPAFKANAAGENSPRGASKTGGIGRPARRINSRRSDAREKKLFSQTTSACDSRMHCSSTATVKRAA